MENPPPEHKGNRMQGLRVRVQRLRGSGDTDRSRSSVDSDRSGAGSADPEKTPASEHVVEKPKDSSISSDPAQPNGGKSTEPSANTTKRKRVRSNWKR